MYLLPTRTLIAIATFLLIAPVSAQPDPQYPRGPVKLVVPFPTGGPSDAGARLLANKLKAIWNQPVIVENKPGASGTIGAQQVVNAPADGYTLLLGAGASNGAAEVLTPKTTPYRSQRDLAPVAMLGVSPTIMIVSKSVPAKNMKEFVDLARANPGKYSYASASAGSAPSFAFEMLKQHSNLDILQVPFNGAAPALTALMGGHVSAYMGGAFSVLPSIQGGHAHAIGAASNQRSEVFPDVPTFPEQGFPVTWDTWYGVFAPIRVPDAILDKINADINTALKDPEVKKGFSGQGLEIRTGSRKQLSDAVDREIAEATRVGRAARMIVD